MNFIKTTLFLSLVAILSFGSCKKEEVEPTCIQSDWVGTYEGTITINDGDSIDVTIFFTASGDNAVFISYAYGGTSVAYNEPMTLENCEINYLYEDSFGSELVEASLDGDQLTFKDTLNWNGTTTVTEISATKKQ